MKIDKRSFLVGVGTTAIASAGAVAAFRRLHESKAQRLLNFTIRPAEIEDRYFNAMTEYHPLKRRITLTHQLSPRSKPSARWRGRDEQLNFDVPQGLYVVENELGVMAPLAVTSEPNNPTAPLVVIIPNYTAHAYNRVGGGSLYTKNDWVSILRPQINSWKSSIGYHPLRILEEAGIAYDLILQSDLDNPNFGYDLRSYESIVLYGHDEYWTGEIRRQIEAAVEAGSRLVCLSGNTCFWRLKREKNQINRNTYGHYASDPEFGGEEKLLGGAFRYAGFPVMRFTEPEEIDDRTNQLLRMGFPSKPLKQDFESYTAGVHIIDPAAELLRNTDLQRGSFLTGNWPILDVEFDGIPLDDDGNVDLDATKGFEPDELEIAAEGWGVRNDVNHFGFGLKSRFRKGGYVYSLASIGWVRADLETGGALRQMTLNALGHKGSADAG